MTRGLAFLLALATVPPAFAGTGTWNFRVLLDGREIGHHSYQLRPDGGGVELRSEARFDVRLLFISAYRYRHDAIERWQDGCLRGLESETVTNGERVAVSARDVGGRLSVERPGATDTHAGCIFSFAYWDPRILEATALLNSQTGELVPVMVERLGTEPMTVQGRELPTTRHRITGTGLQIDLWYADRRWVALEALTEGGRRLRYELTEEKTT
jgi:hypothetical protein